MRKFTVTTTISKQGTSHLVRRPSKDIQIGDTVKFLFNDGTLTALVGIWDTAANGCSECVLFNQGPSRCVHYKDKLGRDCILCNSGYRSLVLKSIDDLMEEI